MTEKKSYPKQPYNPNRTPAKSVTWVRNAHKHVNTKRVTVVVPKPAFVPKRQRKEN